MADGAARATDGRITAFDGDDCVELELMMMNTPRFSEFKKWKTFILLTERTMVSGVPVPNSLVQRTV